MQSKRTNKQIVHPPEVRRRKLLALLADGKFYSGEELARELRVTRSAIWKLIGKLRGLGIDIQALSRQGYHLPHAVELYDPTVLQAALSVSARQSIHRVDTLLTVDSTNRFLIDAAAPPVGQAAVCVAEVQTAGRGRRGRSWLAPFGSGVCLSLAWQFAESPPTFSALSLAVGLAVVRALRRFGAESAQLKWPNDVVWTQRKLAGILIEMRGEASGPARVVIGIGMNLHLPATTRLALAEQQAALVTDLHEMLGQRTPGRNALVAAMIDELITMLRQFEREGFPAFEAEWRDRDSLLNSPVRVLSASETINGIARGVAADGALLVEVNGQTQRFMSGDVSLRAALPR
jgi:BirA family transcriptional regulator, biotin operon repressor / biotin---[acetyl-CoA-carboxylase] ligase